MIGHKKAAGVAQLAAAYKDTAAIEQQFTEAAHFAGIRLTGAIIADGTLHRCHLDG
jgi:putative DNA primase/helicase